VEARSAPETRSPTSSWNGRELRLGANTAKVVAIEFWASWCAPCRESLPALAALRQKYGKQVEVVAIGIDRDRRRADEFLHVVLPRYDAVLVHDPGSDVMSRFGAPGMPALYVACDGIVRFVAGGFSAATRESVERSVAACLGGSTPSGKGETPMK
jgi:thiol-disulfide isomerase/thioredoxin